MQGQVCPTLPDLLCWSPAHIPLVDSVISSNVMCCSSPAKSLSALEAEGRDAVREGKGGHHEGAAASAAVHCTSAACSRQPTSHPPSQTTPAGAIERH